MRRVLALVCLLTLAWAQSPAYPENAFGVGYGEKGLALQGNLVLPLSPLGIETGLDLWAFLPSLNPARLEGRALLKANLLPGLVFLDRYLSLGMGLDLRYPFGLHLGPVASLDLGGAALSLGLGLGYQGGLHLAFGAGLRAYLDPLALELSASDQNLFLLSLLYLF